MFALYVVIIIYGITLIALSTPWIIRKYRKEGKIWPLILVGSIVLILLIFELCYRFDVFAALGYPYDNPGVPLN